MSIDIVPPNLCSVFAAIDGCSRADQPLPALMLLYAVIDIVAALDAENGEASRAGFEDWVSRYVLPAPGINCTPTDLYAARCGILHTMSADARLVNKGIAKRLVYARKGADISTMTTASLRLGEDQVVVELERLRDVVALGVNRFLDAAASNAALENRIALNASGWFSVLPENRVRRFTQDLVGDE